MLNVKVTGLLCISMLPVASSCNFFADIVNFYANLKKCFHFNMIICSLVAFISFVLILRLVIAIAVFFPDIS